MLRAGKAPPFEIPDLSGRPVSLTGLLERGPVVLAFFKVACPTCQLTMPFLARIARENTRANIVAISQDDLASTNAFHKRFGINLPTLFDGKPKYPASNAFGLTNVPTVFTVEPDGSIASAFTGFVKEELMRLGERFGVATFREGEKVPALKPG